MHEQDESLVAEIAQLRREVAMLNGHRFIRVQNSLWRMLGFQFLRGLALGLGSVIGATLLVSFAVYLLSHIDFVPILGDWAAEIASQMKN